MKLQAEQIKIICREIGVDEIGITPVSEVATRKQYLNRIEEGFPAELAYLEKYREERFNPARLLPGAKAVIVIGRNYNPTREDKARQRGPYKVAKYAWGKDYHNVLRRKLRKLRSLLKEIDGELEGRICVDTAPFMDVYWAQKAGIGWQGKNSLLINKRFGPRLMIGSLIINREVDIYDEEHKFHCGNCTACIDACPTGAIEEPFRIEASKCLSYWTIESKSELIPKEIAKKQDNWIFGCDICTDVCPFTRFEIESKEPDFARTDSMTLMETGEIVSESDEAFKKQFQSSPVSRPGLSGIKRNIKSTR